MRRGLVALALAVAAAAAPAQAAGTVVPVARNHVATCVRDAGGGQLTLQAPVTRRSTPTDLLSASPEQVARAAGTDLGALFGCPEVASGGGVTIVAGQALSRDRERIQLRVAVRGASGDFEPAATLATLGSTDVQPAVAVGPRGDAVVAWAESRGDADSDRRSVRILAARRPAGQDWGRAEEVVPAIEQGVFPGRNAVAAGIDAEGRVTIAWALGLKESRRVSDLSRVGVSTAGPGDPLRRTTLLPSLQDVGSLSLAVAPDGAALLVVTGQEQVHRFERPAGGAFAAREPLGSENQIADEAAVALDPSGAAVVAWHFTSYDQDRQGVQAVRRPTGGTFGSPAVVWTSGPPEGRGTLAFAVDVTETSPPLDDAVLRAAVASDGRTAITWAAPRDVAGDRLPAGFVATADRGRDFAVTQFGNPCRPVNGLTPFSPSAARLAIAWTDNAAERASDELEIPLKSGRLHVDDAPPAQPAAASPAPGVSVVRSRRTQRLWSSDPIEVRAGCDAPCDLRAFVPGSRGPRLAAGASLEQGGRATIPLYEGPERVLSLEPRDLRVVVHACSPDGTNRARATTTVRAVHNRPPPVPKPTGVRARRRGDEIVVSWTTPFPARRTSFVAYGHLSPDADAVPTTDPAFVEGKARRRFRVRTRIRPGREVRFVTVQANVTEYRGGSAHTTVPLSR